MGERPLGRMKDMFLLVLSYSLGPMICTGSRARRSRRTAKFGVPCPQRQCGPLLSIAEKVIVNAHLQNRLEARLAAPCKGASG